MKPAQWVSRRTGLVMLGVVLLGAFVWVVARTGPLAPIRVTIATLEEGTLEPSLFGIGTVEARRSYVIGPTAAGRVLRVLVDVGEPVKAGHLLAEMDPVDLDERLAALDASLARSGSAIASADAARRDSEARRAVATINARRYTELGQRNFVSASAVETRQQEHVSAQAASNAAEANLAGARQDMARIKAERDGLRQQRNNVRLLAPSDGIVSARDAEPGSTAVAGQPVVRLIDPSSLWIRLRIDQGRSGGLAPGLPAEIILRSTPSQALPGKVARLEVLSDNVTEERVAQVTFDTTPPGVSVGELAEVTLKLPASLPGLRLPNAAIRQHSGKSGVWVRNNGELRFVTVRQGLASLDGRVLVQGELKAGDQVVVFSEKELSAGSRIRIVDSLTGQGS